jgi:hypothetical protein
MEPENSILCSEKPEHSMLCSQDPENSILRLQELKSRRISRGEGKGTNWSEDKCMYTHIWLKSPKERNMLEDLGIDEKIILKLI